MLPCLNPDCGKQNPDGTNFCQSCGTRFVLKDRYRFLRSIGQGGFGRTYLVEDQGRGNARAVIKQFFPDPEVQNNPTALAEAVRLFEQEADRLLQLDQHPQIPILFEYFEQDGSRYLVQQYIEGPNLHEELEQQKTPFTETQIRDLLLDLLPVLKFIHAHEVIHRDLKPANILRRRSDGRLVLVDFGAAKAATQTALARTATRLYTLGYGAPEQEAGRGINFATDLYGLGATCLYLLTQQNPLDLFDYSQFKWTWRSAVPQPISGSLARIIDKLVEKGIASRYQSADEVLKALKRVQLATISNHELRPLPQKPAPKSARGIDFTKLELLLAAKRWQEADNETGSKIMEVAGDRHVETGFVMPKDIDKLPRTDLRTIDQLWSYYSEGRFGFSVQKHIYLSLGGTRTNTQAVWEKFGDAVGWRASGQWLAYPDILFKGNAPYGHLPLFLFFGCGTLVSGQGAGNVFDRL